MNLPLLYGILLAWAGLCALAARGLGPLLGTGPTRLLLQFVLFAALLPLVVADELLAQPQFEAACRERAVLAWHAPLAVGKPLELAVLPSQPVEGLWLPASSRRWAYVDAVSQEPVASYEVLRAEGGKLSRLLAGGTPTRPLTFEPSCAPTADRTALALLESARVDRDAQARVGPLPTP